MLRGLLGWFAGVDVGTLLAVGAFAALLGYAGWQTVELADARAALASEQRDRARWHEQLQREAFRRSELERGEFERRIAAQQEAQDAARRALLVSRADGDRAARAAAGLRERLAAVSAAAREQRAPSADPAAAAGGQAAAALAELLGRCSDRHRELAREADSAHVAGLACERAYDALTPATAWPAVKLGEP